MLLPACRTVCITEIERNSEEWKTAEISSSQVVQSCPRFKAARMPMQACPLFGCKKCSALRSGNDADSESSESEDDVEEPECERVSNETLRKLGRISAKYPSSKRAMGLSGIMQMLPFSGSSTDSDLDDGVVVLGVGGTARAPSAPE